MNIWKIKEEVEKNITGIVYMNEPLKRHSSIGIGGIARLMIWVDNEADTVFAYNYLIKKKFHIEL